MALSYSGIVNYGKVTLPSVESWGTNMNILKDPPKSVHTRKIDKVGETSAITTSIDESGDRFCEAINYTPEVRTQWYPSHTVKDNKRVATSAEARPSFHTGSPGTAPSDPLSGARKTCYR